MDDHLMAIRDVKEESTHSLTRQERKEWECSLPTSFRRPRKEANRALHPYLEDAVLLPTLAFYIMDPRRTMSHQP